MVVFSVLRVEHVSKQRNYDLEILFTDICSGKNGLVSKIASFFSENTKLEQADISATSFFRISTKEVDLYSKPGPFYVLTSTRNHA